MFWVGFFFSVKMSLRKELLQMVVDCRTSPGCVRLASACVVPSARQQALAFPETGWCSE